MGMRFAAVLLLACFAATLLPSASALVLGIDFGATYFKVALVKPGQAFTIVTNTASKRKTTTMVAFGDENERLYAGDAENLLTRRPLQTYSQVRTLLGRNISHPMVQKTSKALIPHLELIADEIRGTVRIKNALADPEKTGRPESFSAEELTAMILSYAKQIGEAEAGGKINDIVLTVPSYYTQFERQALIDSATIVGLNVLSMLDENTAAAVQYGIDRVFENTTHKMLIYNFGANSLQVSLNYYTSRNMKRLGTNTTVGQFEVVSKAFVEGIGGKFQDMLIANFLADGFNTQMTAKGKNEGYDVRTKLRPWAKLCKKARKVKEVLSANEMIPVFVESVDMDKDLKGLQITRAEFAEMCADMFDVATKPIQQVLDDAGIGVNDIDQVEIIGGSVRIPRIQEVLKEYLNVTHLGVHLNGDEAMALGAAFHAANRSKNFRVRHVGMQDVSPFAIGVKLEEKAVEAVGEDAGEEGEEAAATEAAEEADAAEEGEKKKWSKRATLFKRMNRLYSRKLVSFSHTKDFQCTLRYDQGKKNPLPAGTPRDIQVYDVAGVEDLMQLDKYKELGTPKINLSFLLDTMGFVGLVKAEAVFEEVIEPEPEPEEEVAEEAETETETAADGAETEGEGEESAEGEEEKAEGDEEQAEGDEAKADSGEDDAAEGEESAEGEKTGEEKDEEKETEEDEKKKKKKKKKPRKKTHKVPLTFTAINSPKVLVKTLSEEDLKASQTMIKSLDSADEERRLREQVMNELESSIYACRDLIRDEDHGAFEVTTEEYREELNEKLMELEDWLYDGGPDAPLQEARDKKQEVMDAQTAIKEKIAEKVARPAAAQAFRDALEATEVQLAGWTEELKPQIKESEKEEVKTLVEEATDWINEKEAAQVKLDSTEEAAFTSAEVSKKLKSLQKVVKKLLQKPKPRNVTLTPPKPPAQICSESDFNTDAKCAAADETRPKYDVSKAFKDCLTTKCQAYECCKAKKKKKKKKKKKDDAEAEAEAEAEGDAGKEKDGEGAEDTASADDDGAAGADGEAEAPEASDSTEGGKDEL